MISNRKSAYTPLFNRHKEIAIKPITADGASLENGLELSFLTRRMDASEVAAIPEEAFATAPTLMQPYIEKQCELRITTVGTQTFCCRIESTAMEADRGGVDWRAGACGLRHRGGGGARGRE